MLTRNAYKHDSEHLCCFCEAERGCAICETICERLKLEQAYGLHQGYPKWKDHRSI